MKPEKVFVRYKNLNQQPSYPRERNQKRPYEKKKYAEKHNKTREPFKTIYDSFLAVNEPSPRVQQLAGSFPTFFTSQPKDPEKQSNELLTDYLIFNTKKFLQSLKEPKKEVEHVSSSEPDWNSDEEIDCNMESKIIDQAVINKIADKLKDKPIKKVDTLKPHEKRFLEDYFRAKRQQDQDEDHTPPSQLPVRPPVENKPQTSDTSPGKVTSASDIRGKAEDSRQEQKPKLFWSQYQERQVSTFVDMGFMTKIEQNDEEMPIEVIEDDDLFNEEESKNQSSAKSSSSSEDEEDDIFGDEGPSTTIKTKKEERPSQAESEKKITQGTVVINEHIFSNIAEAVGLLPARCNWIIKNDTNKYKVSTDYMDAYYRKEKMYEILPLISLNHSPFVQNSQVGTSEALQKFRDFNYRRSHQSQFTQRHKHYKEKHTHLKKN